MWSGFGIINTGNPKHADIFLVTGSVNEPEHRTWSRRSTTRWSSRRWSSRAASAHARPGIFHDCYNVIGGVDQAIPVDVYAPGCAVRPEAIIDAVVQGLGILEEKSKALQAQKKGA